MMTCNSFRDISCQRFGRWTAQNEYKTNSNGERKWLCHSDCRTDRYVLGRSMLYRGLNNATLYVDFFPLLNEFTRGNTLWAIPK